MPPPKIKESAFSADVIEFARLLQRSGVRYLVIGGEAVIFHGYPRGPGTSMMWNVLRRTNRNRERGPDANADGDRKSKRAGHRHQRARPRSGAGISFRCRAEQSARLRYSHGRAWSQRGAKRFGTSGHFQPRTSGDPRRHADGLDGKTPRP